MRKDSLPTLPKAIYSYIELELKHYDYLLERLEELRQDILHSSPAPSLDAIQTNRISDVPYSKVLQLTSSVEIAHMSKMVKVIDRALTLLSEDHAHLFELKYRQGKTWQQCTMEMPCSRAKFFRLNTELVKVVAVERGLAVYAKDRKIKKDTKKRPGN